MRRQRIDTRLQTPTSPLTTTRHTTTVATLLTWCILGTGVGVLLARLTAELVPALTARVRFPTSTGLARDPQSTPREDEPLGLVPFTFDDYFARL